MIGDYIVKVDGSNITNELKKIGTSIKYTDNMGLASDTMDFELNNSTLDREELFPTGAEVETELIDTKSGRSLKTGLLFVDTHSGKIGVVKSLKAGTNSQPMNLPGLKKMFSYSKKRVKLKILLETIIKKGGMNLVYRFEESPGMPWDVKLKNVTVQNQTVGSLLEVYRAMFGCMLKVYNDRIIFANKQSFNQDPIVRSITPSSDAIWNFEFDINEHQDAEYEVSYYNPRTGKYTGDKKNKKSTLITKSETVKQIIANIADASAARALAMAVDGQRQALVTFSTTWDPAYIAGGVLHLTGLNKLSGKYVITKAVHNLSNQWTTEINAENIF